MGTYIYCDGRHHIRCNDPWNTGPRVGDPKNGPGVVWCDVSVVNENRRELEPTECERERQESNRLSLLETRHVT